RVAPLLLERAGLRGSRIIRILRSWGLPESLVGEQLDDLFDVHGNPAMALLASDAAIKVRLVADAPTDAAAGALTAPVEAEVRRRLGDAVFGTDDETVEARIHALLTARGARLAVAESLTGGIVTARLTEVLGASDAVAGGMVVYATDSKVDPLGV